MGRIIVGTAGHIDHGKSSLVRALTGTDPDRLPEEKRRQITIDLGFAFLDDVAAIIDVPGHEKFIHNMVAGAATVDFALLVIAADDGVMPQTREHLHILRLLGIPSGAIVLTKCGVTEASWQELVVQQIREVTLGTFLQDAPLFQVDSLAGTGIPELRHFLLKTLPTVSRKPEKGILRIPIDRVFSVHGHGTVVTGTVLSGTVEREQRVELLPGKIAARVKQLQSNARDHTVIRSGMRAALNLSSDRLPERGQTLTAPDALRASRRLAIRFEQIGEAPQIKDRQRVRILIGTQEVMARFRLFTQHGGYSYGLLLLDTPVVATWNDRFIVRRYSPMTTLGGGVVLEYDPPLRLARQRASVSAFLAELTGENLAIAVSKWLEHRALLGEPLRSLGQRFGVTDETLLALVSNSEGVLRHHAGFTFHRTSMQRWQKAILAELSALHEKQRDATGFTTAQVASALKGLPEPLLTLLLKDMQSQGKIALQDGLLRSSSSSPSLDSRMTKLVEEVLRALHADGFAPRSSSVLSEALRAPKTDVDKALVAAARSGRAMRLGTDLFFEMQTFQVAIESVRALLKSQSTVQVSELSKVLESSRKYTVPFLEYLDTQGITERRGNDRVPGRNFNK